MSKELPKKDIIKLADDASETATAIANYIRNHGGLTVDQVRDLLEKHGELVLVSHELRFQSIKLELANIEKDLETIRTATVGAKQTVAIIGKVGKVIDIATSVILLYAAIVGGQPLTTLAAAAETTQLIVDLTKPEDDQDA